MAQQQVQTQEPVREGVDAGPLPGVEPAPGPGVLALEALLKAGMPEPKQVVAVIDAHRSERDAIFARLHQSLGNAYVQRVVQEMGGLRASIDRREVAAGDPSHPEGGFFVASQKEQGARWRTGDGDFSGSIDKKGLDTRYQLDEDDALHGKVGADKSASLAWERDGKTQAELYGHHKGSDDQEIGLRRPWQVGDGTLTTGLRHRTTQTGTTDGAFAGYKSTDGKTTADAALGVQDGQVAGSLAATHKLTPQDSIAGSLSHDPTGTRLGLSGSHAYEGGSISGAAALHRGPQGTTGSVSGALQHGDTKADASYTHGLESDKFHLGGSHKFSPQLDVTGKLDHERKRTGESQTTLGLSERYRSDRLVHGLSLDAGTGERDYLGVTGSADMQLGKGVYGGAFGSFRTEEGKQTTAQLGASLTFTPSEKTALTLAGVLDQSGALEARLQLDVFQKRISSVGDLADHKKKALVSLFVSYSQGGSGGMLNDRYGTPQAGFDQPTGSGQVMGGVKISF